MKTFKGGVHPNEYKELTQEQLIEDCPSPGMVYLALSQHLGKPAKSVVKAGDKVEEGTLVAEADGFISAPIHSPVTGTVKKIGKHPHVLGQLLDTIIIERDKEAEPKKWERKDIKVEDVDKEQFINAIKDMGVVGLGGAGFPTFVKFMTKEGQHINRVVINACECEPYVNVDYRAMLEEIDWFVTGLKLILQATDVDEIVVGIEDNKPEAIKILRNNLDHLERIRVEPVKTKYPQGGEKMLIKAALDLEVPRGGLPLDVGVVVVNVNTVIAITNAIFYDKPILEKIITVSGLGVNNPKNVRAKVGTPFSELVDFCGGLNEKVCRLVVGGPMMGFALTNQNAAVLKTTTGLLALTEKEIGNTKTEPCLKCGSCVGHCPMGLVPSELAKYIEYGRIDLAEKIGLMDCMECGSCVFECPSHRPIVQLIKVGKLKKRDLDNKKKG